MKRKREINAKEFDSICLCSGVYYGAAHLSRPSVVDVNLGWALLGLTRLVLCVL